MKRYAHVTGGGLLLAWSLQFSPALPASQPAAGNAPLAIELVVRTVNNFSNARDVANFFRAAKRAQVSAVHINVKQDEDDERPSGQVYYASKIAPIAQGYGHFDVLAAAVAEGHRLDIKVYAWMPQFHDQAAMRRHPEWQMQAAEGGISRPYSGQNRTEYFINPIDPEVQSYERSLIEEVVRNYRVDGISLDWLRFDELNMDTGNTTRRLALQEIGVDPLRLDFAQPSAALAAWQSWRNRQLGAYVHSIRQALRQIHGSVKLAAFLLPPEFTEVGQNLASFSSDLDEALPMAYFKDWEMPVSWVNSKLLPDIMRKKSSHTMVKPTLDGSGTNSQNMAILAAVRKNFPQIRSVVWFRATDWRAGDIDRIRNLHQAALGNRGTTN